MQSRLFHAIRIPGFRTAKAYFISSMVIEAFKFFTNMKISNTESQVPVQKLKTSAKDPYLDRRQNCAQPQNVPKPMQNLKRTSQVVHHETELLPKVQKIATAVEIKPVAVKTINSEVVQFTYDDKEECSVTSSNNSEKQPGDLEDEAVEEISIDEIPNLTGNESGLIKIETDQFEQLPVSSNNLYDISAVLQFNVLG